MYVECFPKCCGAGVLVIEHLTGKGEKEDWEEFKRYIYYAKRNGYRMYDFPTEYGGVQYQPRTSKSVIGGKGDQKTLQKTNGWGMLLAITTPNLHEAAKRMKQLGFENLLTTHNPIMGHSITLWGLNLNKITEAQVKPDSNWPAEEIQTEAALGPANPFITMTGTMGAVAKGSKPKKAARPRIRKAKVPA